MLSSLDKLSIFDVNSFAILVGIYLFIYFVNLESAAIICHYFLQVFEGLKPSDKFEKILDYRYLFVILCGLHVTNFASTNHGNDLRNIHSKLICRWPARYDQWWECKFIAEGIIDQGGGFRDSLADMSEELCPSSAECAMPLPFFCRTSNQVIGQYKFFLSSCCGCFTLLTLWYLSGCLRGQRLLCP